MGQRRRKTVTDRIYYLIPLFIMIDATLTYLAVSMGLAKEINPLWKCNAGSWTGIIISALIAVLVLEIIAGRIRNKERFGLPFNIVLFAHAIIIINNSIGMFIW